MKCPICGKELELMKKKVGTDENGSPILNQYAVCRDCKKQWNLDKQRANNANKKKEKEEKAAPKQKQEESVKKPVQGKEREEAAKRAAARKAAGERKEAVKRSVPAEQAVDQKEQKYGNVPPERIRAKKERAVRQAYEDMLSTDPNYKPKKKKDVSEEDTAVSKKAVKKKAESIQQEKKRPELEKKRSNVKPSKAYEVYEDELEDDSDYMNEEPNAKYRVIRVILGILSILAFGYFGYKGFVGGLGSVASGDGATGGMTYIILAICMLAAGLLLLILQNSRGIAAYLIPILIYLGGGVFAFLKRGDDKILLYSAIGGAVLALIMIILAATSRNQDDEYDDDYDEDDDFEDEFDDFE